MTTDYDIRLDYVNTKLELLKKADDQRTKLLHARIAAENANIALRDIESEIYQLLNDYIEKREECAAPSDHWHPASDVPETKDGWFIALTKDNLPFLTHYVNGWLPQVHMWKYIFLPMNNDSL